MVEDWRQKLRSDSRIQIVLGVGISVIFVVGVIASQYGNRGIEEVSGVRHVQSDGEHCGLVLPDDWTWRPATWTAVSPNGTEVGFSESLYGRPDNPEWEDAIQDIQARYGNQQGVDLQIDADTVRIDFGEGGGLSVIRRFDRVGCRLTFSGVQGNRDTELLVWEDMIQSLVRTSPTGNPEEELPWKTP